MKLNSPIQIKSDLNDQKRIDIDLGIKLSNRVDEVRNKLASEEAKLEKFKTETIKIVQDEIDAKIAEKDFRTKEIETLEERRKKLLEPLNKEWENLRKEKDKIILDREELGKTSVNLVTSIENVESRKAWNKFESNRLHNVEIETRAKFNNAVKLENQAIEELEEAKKKANGILNPLLERERAVIEKEEQIRVFQSTLEGQKKELENNQIELAEERRQLDDQRKIIERQLKR